MVGVTVVTMTPLKKRQKIQSPIFGFVGVILYLESFFLWKSQIL